MRDAVSECGRRPSEPVNRRGVAAVREVAERHRPENPIAAPTSRPPMKARHDMALQGARSGEGATVATTWDERRAHYDRTSTGSYE